MFVMADGSRYFSIEDMSKDDYLLLSNLELDKIPLILRALVADILWINKKDFNAAQIAADAFRYKQNKLQYITKYKVGLMILYSLRHPEMNLVLR